MEPSASAILNTKFPTAIVDPPWYPDAIRTWISWTAQFIADGGNIFVVIWPPCTRPTAKQEIDDLLKWADEWSLCDNRNYPLFYEMPLFEKVALKYSKSSELARSPRRGHLIKLEKQSDVKFIPTSQKNERWIRFVLNNYQIALRSETTISQGALVRQHHCARNWDWPFVSRRAPGRSKIDLWSSRNEVGMVSS